MQEGVLSQYKLSHDAISSYRGLPLFYCMSGFAFPYQVSKFSPVEQPTQTPIATLELTSGNGPKERILCSKGFVYSHVEENRYA